MSGVFGEVRNFGEARLAVIGVNERGISRFVHLEADQVKRTLRRIDRALAADDGSATLLNVRGVTFSRFEAEAMRDVFASCSETMEKLQ